VQAIAATPSQLAPTAMDGGVAFLHNARAQRRAITGRSWFSGESRGHRIRRADGKPTYLFFCWD
jgi:hypothetical protein